jgi:ATP-dependent Lhr-like helicase
VPDRERSSFEKLHPAVQHHVVNSLGWASLRPLQDCVIEPILAGDHVLATAPTAGGKTEAAMLPLLSRMVTEDWHGVSVLYICPLRALLNSLHERLERYAGFVGRSAGVWHGDVAQSVRGRMLTEPPDILLTTPESLEGMLVSTRVDHAAWFAGVRAVVVDEVHAFAGDDRGWHLLAVLERIRHLAAREFQRIALSATVGNPDELLRWLTSTSRGPGQVISSPVDPTRVVEVTLDSVGSLENAALVIARLHQGEKRLVFVDSRARAEQLSVSLRERGVTTFVSHASLAASERRAAEQAFAQDRDCVIVATSTLELGIDVGDLDRVIQIDSPPTVASFLQRLGRTGRRAGQRPNALVLATTDGALLRSAAVLLRWSEGYVEPVIPPQMPLHILAQQILALALQEAGIGRHAWQKWLGDPLVLGRDALGAAEEVVDHLVRSGFLFDDGTGILGMGPDGEKAFGRRHFMELLSVFTSPPMFSVRSGRNEVGLVPDEALTARSKGTEGQPHVLVLAARSWAVKHVDWTRRVVQVEPTEGPGVARWSGSPQPMGAAVARGMRDVLLGYMLGGVVLSKRAARDLQALRDQHPWVQKEASCLVVEGLAQPRWWTFAGWKANLALTQVVGDLRHHAGGFDGLSIALDPGTSLHQLGKTLAGAAATTMDPEDIVMKEAVRGLKFSACLPEGLAVRVIASRLTDETSRRQTLNEKLTGWRSP